MQVGPFFADFLCRSHRLIVEIDGHSHDIAPQRDAMRDRYLRQAGYTVMHFQNAEVAGNVEGVIIAIRSALGQGPIPNPSCKREAGR